MAAPLAIALFFCREAIAVHVTTPHFHAKILPHLADMLG
jgi:hypothetical protein